MKEKQTWSWTLVPIGLAALELLHPNWSGTDVSDAVRASGPWWVVLHLLLLLGYAALAARLLKIASTSLQRCVLIAFSIANTIYLAVDGLAVGLLAEADPVAADALWSSTWVSFLADITGATWAASLLLLAVGTSRTRAERTGAAITWLAFAASTVPAIAAAAIGVSRTAALATGMWAVYRRGSVSLPLALLAFAAVLRQHVGAEAAFGLVLVAIATARSGPAAGSPL